MILPNNPRIDVDEVERQVERILAGRRISPLVDASRTVQIPGRPGLTWRQRVKMLPLVGPVLFHLYLRAHRIVSPRLGWRERVKAIPVLGELIHLGWILIDLPRFRLATAQDLATQRQELLNERARINELLRLLEQQRQAAEAGRQVLARGQADLERRQQAQREELLAQCRLLEDRHAIHSRALRLLEKSFAGADLSVRPAATGHPVAPGELGNFYFEFETRFRGTPESVRERMQPYLSHVRSATQDSTSPRCVDIGCGRGEWLELMKAQGIDAIGIDLNAGMVMACRERGLNAICADGIAWLREQPPGSVDVISAFQVIEHLSFPDLIELLDASREALSQGGVAIFETPNPENLIVGATNFYYDPTHLHPIPPPVAAFIAEQRGFRRVEILRLNAYPESMQLPGDDEVSRRLNGLLYGSQDYALIVGKRLS